MIPSANGNSGRYEGPGVAWRTSGVALEANRVSQMGMLGGHQRTSRSSAQRL